MSQLMLVLYDIRSRVLILHVIDVSIEQVAHRAQENSLPQPILELSKFAVSSNAPIQPVDSSPPTAYDQAGLDPWSYGGLNTVENDSRGLDGPTNSVIGLGGGAPVALTGGLGKNWWNNQSKIEVSIIPEKQGFLLARYTAYMISSDVRNFFD